MLYLTTASIEQGYSSGSSLHPIRRCIYCVVQELATVAQQLRANVPSAAAHFETLEEALDPENEIEKEYYPTANVVS
jgi:hypothetical protein